MSQGLPNGTGASIAEWLSSWLIESKHDWMNNKIKKWTDEWTNERMHEWWTNQETKELFEPRQNSGFPCHEAIKRAWRRVKRDMVIYTYVILVCIHIYIYIHVWYNCLTYYGYWSVRHSNKNTSDSLGPSPSFRVTHFTHLSCWLLVCSILSPNKEHSGQ